MRRGIAAAIAAVPMVMLAAVHVLGMCYPGCAIWNESNPEWHWFLCWLCAMV
jgi:hypothetical protein